MLSTDERFKLFVYGTLKYGEGNNAFLIERGAEFVCEATADGIFLLDLGPFPAAIEEEGYQVVGELWVIDKDTLDTLDVLEGYSEKDHRGSLYLRKIVKTNVGNAFTYIYNDITGGIANGFEKKSYWGRGEKGG